MTDETVAKIVAEMPKTEFPNWNPYYPTKRYSWDRAIEAQCQLLAEQGWRKVPSVTEIADKLISSPLTFFQSNAIAGPLRRWLLEGE